MGARHILSRKDTWVFIITTRNPHKNMYGSEFHAGDEIPLHPGSVLFEHMKDGTMHQFPTNVRANGTSQDAQKFGNPHFKTRQANRGKRSSDNPDAAPRTTTKGKLWTAIEMIITTQKRIANTDVERFAEAPTILNKYEADTQDVEDAKEATTAKRLKENASVDAVKKQMRIPRISLQMTEKQKREKKMANNMIVAAEKARNDLIEKKSKKGLLHSTSEIKARPTGQHFRNQRKAY